MTTSPLDRKGHGGRARPKATPIVAAVTGATSGIGAATVRVLAGRGIPVVATGRRRDRLDQLERELIASGAEVVPLPGDLARDDLVPDLAAAARAHWGQNPSVFVLCAGMGLPGTILSSDSACW